MDFARLRGLMEEKGYDLSGKGYHPYRFDISEYVKRHDVVFRGPMLRPFEALPVGNGDIAAMVWNTDTGLRMQINKNDLWTAPDEEAPMLQRGACQVEIDFGAPVFDYMYLDDFEARLSMADGRATFSSSTPFARQRAALYADMDSNVLIADLEGETDGPAALRVLLERYGSRAFMRWESRITGGAHYGLGKAKVCAEGDTLLLTEAFDDSGSLSLAVAVRCLDGAERPVSLNGRSAEMLLTHEGAYYKRVLISVALAHGEEPPVQEAIRRLDECAQRLDEVRQRALDFWKDYWNRSFVHISRADERGGFDYMENLYCMQMYVLAISSRADYLMTFNGGLCTWNHDYRFWVNPHHWNTQQAYWAVEAANHPEIMEPYLKTYHRIYPQMAAFAKEMYGSDNGIAIAEMHDFSGRMLNFKNTMTPVQQIAMTFWNHYRYNQDEKFLREVGFPFIAGAASLYSDYAKYDEHTGECIMGPCMPYESSSYDDLYNTTVDAAMMRATLPAAMEAAKILGIEDERTAAWKYLYEHLYDYPYMRDYYYLPNENDMMAMGYMNDRKTIIGPSHGMCRDTCPLMPAGVLGLKDKGTRAFHAVSYTLTRYERFGLMHLPLACMWARLGEGGKSVNVLFDSIDSLQHYPQGLFASWNGAQGRYGQLFSEMAVTPAQKDEIWLYRQRDYLYDLRTTEKDAWVTRPPRPEIRDVCDKWLDKEDEISPIEVPDYPFNQCGFETPGILTHTMNELSMQSYEGVIRVYPAFEKGYEGMFTLKALGGFMVSGAIGKEGRSGVTLVKSLYGGKCVIDLMDDSLEIRTAEGEEVAWSADEDGFVVFDTQPDTLYVLFRRDMTDGDVHDARMEMYVNNGPKAFRNAELGRARQF